MARVSARTWLFALLAESVPAASTRLRSSVAVGAGGFAFDYSKHGVDWIQGVCGSRERQSPINFNIFQVPEPTAKLQYRYGMVKSSFELMNNGHSLSADFSGLGYGGMVYEENWYNLMNLNIHALSEHTFKGVHYPLELHLVHKKYDSDDLLIVAVPVTHTDHSVALLQWQQKQQRRKARMNKRRLRATPAVATVPGTVPQSLAGVASQAATDALASAGLSEEALAKIGEAAVAKLDFGPPTRDASGEKKARLEIMGKDKPGCAEAAHRRCYTISAILRMRRRTR
jgi:carbonic anhydrase